MRSILLFQFVALCACGSPRSETPRPVVPQPEVSPIAEIHEWGLIDVDVASGVAELSTGPGGIAMPVRARKPVLYVHLLEGDARSLTVRARVPGGRILEHWPPGELSADSIGWSFDVRRGPCAGDRGRGRWHTGERERGECASADGFCEIAELPRYVTDDHDCLDVNGTEASLLFYRATVDGAQLPLRIERAADMRVNVTSLRNAENRPRTILRLSTALNGPWPAGRIVAARASIPPSGETVAIPIGDTVIDGASEREAMTRTLAELGLSPSEASAFMGAWGDALFGDMNARGPSSMSQDVLLYWLSPSDVDRLAILEASPSPIRIRRAFLVRITFPGIPTG